jgi:carbon storage regulator
MLVLTRKTEQSICIGDNIVVMVTRISRDAVRIGISAPKDTQIVRSELVDVSITEEKVNEDCQG